MSSKALVPILAGTLSTLSPLATAEKLPLRGLGLDERIDEESHLAGAPSAPPVLFVRLVVPRTTIELEPEVYSFDRLDDRMLVLAGAQILLALDGMPETVEASESFRKYILAVSERYRGRVRGYLLGPMEALAPETGAFLLKLAAVQIRSVDDDASVFSRHSADTEPASLKSLYDEGVAPYVDGLALEGSSRLGEIRKIVDEEDPSATILLTGVESSSLRDVFVESLRNLAAGVSVTTFRASRGIADRILALPDELASLLMANVVALGAEENEASFNIPSVGHLVLFNVDSGSTYLVYWSEDEGSQTVEIEMETFIPDPPRLVDPIGRESLSIGSFTYHEERRRAKVKAPLFHRPLILEFQAPAFGTTVAARVGLDVNQIVAFHQQAQRRQDDLVENYIASVIDAIHFRPTPTDAFDVVIENRFYFDRHGSEWEEISFSFNGAKWGADRPAFPLLQPEKVLSLPLDLQLDRSYRYELVGRESVGNRSAYVVRFTPLSDERSLYRGVVFIDDETFLKLKVESVQTNLSAPVVSSDEVFTYEQQAEIDGTAVFLLTTLESKQLVLIAGRNLLVEKESRFRDFRVNAADFEARRQTARESEHIMLRDTDQGLRYFVKRGGERRIVDELTQSAKALALGAIFDPSFDFPIPIFGFNYLDFDFLETNSQFALLFGGVFALGNVQKSDLFGGSFDASVDFFGFAIPSNDVVFDQNGKIESESLTTVPASFGASLGFQATTFQKVSGRYDLRHDHYGRSESTAEGFVTPSSTFTHGVGLGYEYRRGGYSLVASGTFQARMRWEPWGDVETFDPDTRSYWKYRATLGKDFFFRTFHKIHVDAGIFGGERLDRFTKYQFGLFDETRVHGMPSTAVRFGRLVLARGSYSFNVFEQYRFELFYDHVWGDDKQTALDWVRFSGLGVSVSLRGPRRTVIRFDFGKSILPEALRGAGTMVGQIQILKPL